VEKRIGMMLKIILKSAVAPLALVGLIAAPVQAAPVTPALMLANPAMGGKDGASAEAAIMEMFAKLFGSDDKTPIDPAQLALGQTTAAKLLPDGAYGKMMDQMLGQILKPIMSLDAGMTGIQISLKTGIDYDAAEKLTEEQRNQVAALLDPNRTARNDGMMNLIKPMMVDMGKMLEGPMREGIARAYARKFSAAQLNEVNAFFATPNGAAFAAESFAIQADPEVLSATFQAMPVLMGKMMETGPDLEAQMKALPQERKVSELNEADLNKLAGLLGTTPKALKAYEESAVDLTTTDAVAATDDAADAADTSDSAEAWFDRANWTGEDRAKVEALEQQSSDIIGQQIEAEDAAVERAKTRLQGKSVAKD
jgi:hypothetical protein